MFWRKRRKIKDHEFLIGIDTEPKDLHAAYILGGEVKKMLQSFLKNSRCKKIVVSIYSNGGEIDILNLEKEAE